MQTQSDAASARETAREAAREAAMQVREIQQAIRDGAAEGNAGVEVRNTDGGKVVLITDGDGNVRRIEINGDGQVVSGLEAPGVAIAPPPPPRQRKQLPEGMVEMMGIIFSAVTVMSLGGPLVKAWARRFEKRHDVKQQALVEQRLEAIERAIDSVAVEVERISEGQRFTTKLLADRAPAEMERAR